MREQRLLFSSVNLIKVLKVTIGAFLAILIANLLGISYSTSAGVITILSIQNTKRETLLLVGKRIGAFFIALIIAFLSFHLFGYQVLAIGCFLLLFSSFCYLCSLQDGLVMNTVLMFHFYAEQSMSFFWIKNEMLLLFIGTFIGIIMNTYMPGNVGAIREKQKNLESSIREILYQMAQMITMENDICYTDVRFDKLDQELQKMEIWAYEERDNALISDNQYFIRYVQMRESQSFILKKLYKNINLLHSVPKQAKFVSSYIEEISKTFHEHNNAKRLKENLDTMIEKMKEEPLPVTRGEFENRAILYRILYDLEEFLQIKIQFIMKLTEEEIERFWE